MRRVDAKRTTWTRPESEGVLSSIYLDRSLSQTDRRTAHEIDEIAGIKELGMKVTDMQPPIPEDCNSEGNIMSGPLREAAASNREDQDGVSDLRGSCQYQCGRTSRLGTHGIQ